MDVVGDGCDDSIHHMHNAIGGMLIRFDQSGAVHCHDLQGETDRGGREGYQHQRGEGLYKL